MNESLIPAATKLAAKRAFIRTLFQGYESVLAIGLSANIIVGLVRGEVDVLSLGITAAVTVAAPPLAALRSYLNISHKGIPDDYKSAVAFGAPSQSEMLRRDLG